MLHLSVCSGRAPFRSFMFALHACYVISIALVLFVKLHGLEEEPGKLLLSPLTHKLWLLSQCDTKSRPASSRASSYFCQGKIFARISIPELEMGKCVSFLDARCASIAGTGTKENLSFWEKLTFLYFFFFIFFFFVWGGWLPWYWLYDDMDLQGYPILHLQTQMSCAYTWIELFGW